MSASQLRAISLTALTVAIALTTLTPGVAQVSPEGSRIEVTLSDNQILFGSLLVVSGRLSSTTNNVPIPLATVRLQYYREGDAEFVREVTMTTSNPEGRFEDRVNTTYLLRIGTWSVNASFAGGRIYERASTIVSFNLVVQPSLSLYVSAHDVRLGQSIVIDGLLFACIPCINDEVEVTFTRPDNTNFSITLPLVAIGGPYSGGYYNTTVTLDAKGVWRIKATWMGNDVSLPAFSHVEEVRVGTSTGLFKDTWFPIGLGLATLVVVAILLARRGVLRKNT